MNFGASSEAMSSRTATPIYPSGLSSAMSHTYVNQYAGSDFHLDRVQTPQAPYLPFDSDGGYEEIRQLPFRQSAR